MPPKIPLGPVMMFKSRPTAVAELLLIAEQTGPGNGMPDLLPLTLPKQWAPLALSQLFPRPVRRCALFICI